MTGFSKLHALRKQGDESGNSSSDKYPKILSISESLLLSINLCILFHRVDKNYHSRYRLSIIFCDSSSTFTFVPYKYQYSVRTKAEWKFVSSFNDTNHFKHIFARFIHFSILIETKNIMPTSIETFNESKTFYRWKKRCRSGDARMSDGTRRTGRRSAFSKGSPIKHRAQRRINIVLCQNHMSTRPIHIRVTTAAMQTDQKLRWRCYSNCFSCSAVCDLAVET